MLNYRAALCCFPHRLPFSHLYEGCQMTLESGRNERVDSSLHCQEVRSTELGMHLPLSSHFCKASLETDSVTFALVLPILTSPRLCMLKTPPPSQHLSACYHAPLS